MVWFVCVGGDINYFQVPTGCLVRGFEYTMMMMMMVMMMMTCMIMTWCNFCQLDELQMCLSESLPHILLR
jgi:hypothetical protein